MKYLGIAILALIGIAIGIFVGLGGFEDIGVVIFIAFFPVAFILITILLGKNTDDEKNKKEVKEKTYWDRYE